MKDKKLENDFIIEGGNLSNIIMCTDDYFKEVEGKTSEYIKALYLISEISNRMQDMFRFFINAVTTTAELDYGGIKGYIKIIVEHIVSIYERYSKLTDTSEMSYNINMVLEDKFMLEFEKVYKEYKNESIPKTESVNAVSKKSKTEFIEEFTYNDASDFIQSFDFVNGYIECYMIQDESLPCNQKIYRTIYDFTDKNKLEEVLSHLENAIIEENVSDSDIIDTVLTYNENNSLPKDEFWLYKYIDDGDAGHFIVEKYKFIREVI